MVADDDGLNTSRRSPTHGGENHKMLLNDLIHINRRTCSSLWSVAYVNGHPSSLSPRLIIPKTRNEELRVSEQEARLLFCSSLNNLSYYYSIETPTDELYQLTGQTAQSALSDLSLYSYNGSFEKVANVEFKAHNPPQNHIQKDIEKLIRENIQGNWFHLLKNIDSGTLPALFTKFINSFNGFSKLVSDNNVSVSVLFCFCVLDKKWACYKHFNYRPEQGHIVDYANDFFTLGYNVSGNRVIVNNNNGWIVV